ncbi:hypothetical protein PUNSTDRAFT_124090 [Punctularia strigosozonata HHB-11173 SS5]|uniref:uncharacterized protein n=1 Tax=Punctularia strigosozonata (strain HHB-11173) TaxID=741275 RepID=UPI0004416638|nr:uncharacterized protein PUNSTDRAFT_124090 [Punctularia strigosozonata HHB-11173 SS5]EIN14630.1 hypothetical protein PUNSTDRAFT_124090 [Punctularia strigosozonata HHB-11173 SS5]
MASIIDFEPPTNDIRLSPPFTRNPSYRNPHPRSPSQQQRAPHQQHYRQPSASSNVTWIPPSRYMRQPAQPPPASPIPVPPPAHTARGYAESSYGYGPDADYRSPLRRQQSPNPYGYRGQEAERLEVAREIIETTDTVDDGDDVELQTKLPHAQGQGRFIGGFLASIRRPFGRWMGGPRPRPHIGTGLPTPPTSPGRDMSPQPQPIESMMAQARAQQQQQPSPMNSPSRDVEPLQIPRRGMVPVRQMTADTMDTALTLPRYSVHPPTPTTAQRELEEARERHRAQQEARAREQLHEQQQAPQVEGAPQAADGEHERYVTYVAVESDADGRSALLAPPMSQRSPSHNSRGPSDHPAIAEQDEDEHETERAPSAAGSRHLAEGPDGDRSIPAATSPPQESRPQEDELPRSRDVLTRSPTALSAMSPAPDAARSPVGSPRLAGQVASPVFVEPQPASDYDKMSSAFHTAPSEFSTFASYWDRVQQFLHELADLPWMSTRVTTDFIPSDNPRSRYEKYRLRHHPQNMVEAGVPPDSWYAPAKGHRDLDLLEGGPAPRYEDGYPYGAGSSISPAMAMATRYRSAPLYPNMYPGQHPSSQVVGLSGEYASPEQHLHRMASGYGSARSPPRTRFSLMRDESIYSNGGRSQDHVWGSPRSDRSVPTITRARSPAYPVGGGGHQNQGRQPPTSPSGSALRDRFSFHRRSEASGGRNSVSWYNLGSGRPRSGASSAGQELEGPLNMMSIVSGNGVQATQ